MDIVIPEDRVGDFFFLDDEEEEKAYGASGDYKQAAELTKQLMKGAAAAKDKAQQTGKSDSQKKMMDFKLRVVDFISIYVKQKGYSGDAGVQLKLIRGMLKGLSVAHQDKQQILFDRIKSVLTLMAKQSQQQGSLQSYESNEEDEKVLLTEMSRLLTKPQRDPALQKAYTDCFLLLTKHYYNASSGASPSLTATYKSLLQKFLGGRVESGSAMSMRFWQQVCEQCPALLWKCHESILSCFLAKEGDQNEGSRSNHQRLQAIELYGHLIKAAKTNQEAKKSMYKSFELLTALICKVIGSADKSWGGQKKVKKTGLCVGLFAKAAKTLSSNEIALDIDPKGLITDCGVKIVKELETATEKDKTMANLKGKIKEIKRIIEL